jgi:hypothetical protein
LAIDAFRAAASAQAGDAAVVAALAVAVVAVGAPLVLSPAPPQAVEARQTTTKSRSLTGTGIRMKSSMTKRMATRSDHVLRAAGRGTADWTGGVGEHVG